MHRQYIVKKEPTPQWSSSSQFSLDGHASESIPLPRRWTSSDPRTSVVSCIGRSWGSQDRDREVRGSDVLPRQRGAQQLGLREPQGEFTVHGSILFRERREGETFRGRVAACGFTDFEMGRAPPTSFGGALSTLQEDSPPQFYQACQFRLFKGRCLDTLPKDLCPANQFYGPGGAEVGGSYRLRCAGLQGLPVGRAPTAAICGFGVDPRIVLRG